MSPAGTLSAATVDGEPKGRRGTSDRWGQRVPGLVLDLVTSFKLRSRGGVCDVVVDGMVDGGQGAAELERGWWFGRRRVGAGAGGRWSLV